jgi:transcription elongation factor Elf1
MATNGTMTRTLKSWKLACPLCGAKEAIELNLNDLAGGLTCGECSDSFGVETAVKLAAEQLRRWQAVASWIALAGECLATTSTEAE